MLAQNPNIEILELAVSRLGDLTNELVFLGGCATGLLITDLAASPIRMTRDVDVIAEVSTLSDYHNLAEHLRQRGFKEDLSDDAPICRWVAESLILDVMPTNPSILGFGNQWYVPAMNNALTMMLPSGMAIQSVSAPYFLSTKLEAFDGRGQGDYLLSHDIEDFVAVIDGRAEVVEELLDAAGDVKVYLAERFDGLLRESSFMDSLPGHLPPDQAGQLRLPLVVSRLKAVAALSM
jgi:predicted nucleotidyltransferase